MFGLGTTELIVIGVIIFLIFGAKRIPEIGKGLGGALKEFRNIKKEIRLDEAEKHGKEEGKRPEQDSIASIEGKLTEKVMEQVPGVKTAMDINRKVKKVKRFIK